MNRVIVSMVAVLWTLSLVLLGGGAEALTIYPVDRAEILAGSKFDLKVEFDGVVASGDVRVAVNGVDHAVLFGRPAQFIAREQGVDASALLLRDVSFTKPGATPWWPRTARPRGR
jgi:alkaline phosphatase